jgi:sirohydrochlorin ferrochelatase
VQTGATTVIAQPPSVVQTHVPPLVAVAHGSRDPRSAATAAALMDVVRGLRHGLDVRLAFLDLSTPRLGDALAAVHHGGYEQAVVVPLLLGSAYHATVDLPGVLATVSGLRVRTARVLGPDPRLSAVALHRLAAAGVALDDERLGVVLAAAGSSHPPANAEVAQVAAAWCQRMPWAGAHAAFASACAQPSVPSAVSALRAQGARRIAVAPWFLAPGRLPDRVAHAARTIDPSVVVADPLGPDPQLAQLVLDRYAAALGVPSSTTITALMGL